MPLEDIFSLRAPRNEVKDKSITYRMSELPDYTRYSGKVSIDPSISNEELYAQNQSAWNKWGNAAVKFTALTGTTFAEGTVGLVNGAFQAIRHGDFSKFYDNSFNQSLNQLNENLENQFATYYAQNEKDAAWYSPDTWWTANFWSDTIFKNMGFALGAYLSGGAWSKVFSAVGKAANIASKGGQEGLDALRTMNKVDDAIMTSTPDEIFASTSKRLNELSRSYDELSSLPVLRNISKSNLQKYGDNLLRSVTAASGEAQIEASHAIESYRDKLKEEYFQLHGVEPTGEALSEIETTAKKVGNTVFTGNMLLLTGTNLWQFPKIMGKSWNTERRVVSDAERGLGRMVVKDAEGNIIQREGLHTPLGTIGREKVVADLSKGETYAATKAHSWVGEQLERTIVGKGLNRISPFARFAFSPSEAFEEGMQSYMPLTAEAYFDKGSDTKNDIFATVRKGLSETLFDMKNKDFWTSVISGGITGGLMENANPINGNFGGNLRERMVRRRETAKVASIFNENPKESILSGEKSVYNELKNERLGSYLQELSRSANRSEKLGEEAYNALQKGDRLEYEDLKMDKYLNYLLPRIQYGRKDLVNADIQGWKENASTEEGWQQMIKDGVATEDMSRTEFLRNMDTLLSLSDSIDSHFNYLNVRYGDVRNSRGELRYTPNNLMQMAYVYAKIGDYNNRISQLNTELTESNVNISPFLSMVESNFSDAESIAEQTQNVAEQVLAQIEGNNSLTGEQKEDIFVKVGDMLELFARRKFKVDEYEEMRKNPEAFDRTTKQDAEDNEEEVEEVPVRTENAKENFYNANKDREFQINFGRGGSAVGTLEYSPKTNVLAFRDSEGNLYEVTNEDFKNGLVTGADANDITYTPFLEEQDERVGVKRQNTINAISKVMDDSTNRVNKINEKIGEIEGKIKELSDKITSKKYYIDEDRNFLTWASDQSESLEVLANARMEAEQLLQDLVNERTQLQDQIGVYQDILDKKPVDFQFVLNTIEEQLDLSQKLVRDLSNKENRLSNIIDKIQNAISYWASVIKDRLGLKLAKNPNQLNLVTTNNLIDRLLNNPSVEAYEALRDKLKELNDLNISPTQLQRDRLTNLLNDVRNQLNTAVRDFENLQTVYDELTKNAFDIANPLDPADFIRQEEAIEILSEESEEDEPTPPSHKDYVGSKKLLRNYFRSTKVLNDIAQKHPWYKRYTQATNNFMTLPRSVRDKMRVIFITPSNEEVLGVKGFTDTFFLNKFGTPYYKDQDRFSVVNGAIGAVVVTEQEDGLYFVDQFGNKTNKVGETTDPNTLVGSQMSAATLEWTNGQKGYVEDGLDSNEELKKYTAERERILQDKSATPKTYKFQLSRGTQASYEQDRIVETIVSREDVDKPGLIRIIKTGETFTKNDGETHKSTSRFPLLQTSDIDVPLHVRKIGNYAKSIVAALKVYSRREGENNSEKLVTFLKNILPHKVKIINQNEIDVNGTVYNIQETEDGKLVSLLENKNHQVHSMLQEPFTEFYLDKDGNLQQREWNTYQSFLISNQYNGGNRVSEPILSSDASNEQRNKYMLLQGFMGITSSSVSEETEIELPFEQQQPIPEAQQQYDAQRSVIQQIKDHATNIKNKVREVFEPLIKGKHSKEQVEGSIILLDTIAEAWSKRTGLPKERFYQRFRDVKRSNVQDLVNNNDVLNQIAGLKGILNLNDSIISNNQVVAENMEKELGITQDDWSGDTKEQERQKIKLATGYERGTDGQWRYEIPDGTFNAVENIRFDSQDDFIGNVHEITLGEVYTNDLLYRMYPDLKNTPVLIFNNPGFEGFDSFFYNDKIYINGSEFQGGTYRINEDAQTSGTILHEIQHYIQQTEGFEEGINPMWVRRQVFEIVKSINSGALDSLTSPQRIINDFVDRVVKPDLIKELNRLENIDEREDLFEDLIDFIYRSFAGEVESENVRTRSVLEDRSSLLSSTEAYKRAEQFLGNSMFFQTAGVEGISRLRDAKVHLDMLEEAKKMKKQRISPSLIKANTLWEFDEQEGKWKTELPNTFEVRKGVVKEGATGLITDLIYNADELLEAYPTLNSFSFSVINDISKPAGSHDALNNEITINIAKAKTDKNIKSVLIHEFAHEIQRREGWQPGGNLNTLNEVASKIYERNGYTAENFPSVEEYDRMVESTENPTEKRALLLTKEIIFGREGEELSDEEVEENYRKFYRALKGEVGARIDQARMDMTVDEMAESLLSESNTEIADEDINYIKGLVDQVKSEQVDAWHGSPYKFDRFSTEFMGSGEGAQAFGWGLYFTDLEDIARNYANKLSNSRNILYGGKTKYELEGLHPMTKMFLLDLEQSNPKTKEDAKNWLLRNTKGKSERVLKDLTDAVEKIEFGNISRQVYKVSLHKGKTPDQYTWLEWDKKVDKRMANTIVDAIIKVNPSEFSETYIDYNKDIHVDSKENLLKQVQDMSGKELYNALYDNNYSFLFGNFYDISSTPKEASLFLLENGIDGIKYPAESISRGATSDNTRGFNYVVFDENAITIENHILFQSEPSVEQQVGDAISDTIDTTNPFVRLGREIGFEYTTDTLARERFDIPNLTKIGSGSDRDVYDLGDGKVLKIAKTSRGLEQNLGEGDYLLENYVVPTTYEKGLNYVVVEKYPKAKVSDKVKTYNPETSEEVGETTFGEMIKELSKFSQREFDNHTSEIQDTLSKYGFRDILSYDVLWGDFVRNANWGYKDGRAIHVDGGTFRGTDMVTSYRGKTNLSDPEFREIYNESKRLKKQFGDKDHNKYYSSEGTIYRAAVEVLQDETYILHALEDPTFASLVHEYAHMFEEDLTDEEIQTIEDWSGHKRGTTEFKEAFARGFESYMAEPNPVLNAINQIFAKFAGWMRSIYDGIMNSPLEVELNDDVRKIYDRLLGVERKFEDKMESSREAISDLDDKSRAELMNKLSDLYNRKKDNIVPKEFKKNVVSSYPEGTRVILKSGKVIIVGNTEGLTKSEKNGLRDGTLTGVTFNGIAQAYQTFKDEKIIKSLGVEKSIAPKNLPEINPTCK